LAKSGVLSGRRSFRNLLEVAYVADMMEKRCSGETAEEDGRFRNVRLGRAEGSGGQGRASLRASRSSRDGTDDDEADDCWSSASSLSQNWAIRSPGLISQMVGEEITGDV
jgi:hypothetical protein